MWYCNCVVVSSKGESVAVVRMDIHSVVVGAGPVASLVVLKPRQEDAENLGKLPIRIGNVEAAAISMGVDATKSIGRPLTHDLLRSVILSLGGSLSRVVISRVKDTIFYAQLQLVTPTGETASVDCRPSDALALAVRMHVPIFADERVLTTAALPDFEAVERDERAREEAAFHEFVEGLSPEDFAV